MILISQNTMENNYKLHKLHYTKCVKIITLYLVILDSSSKSTLKYFLVLFRYILFHFLITKTFTNYKNNNEPFHH